MFKCVIVSFIIFGYTLAQDADCDFKQNVQANNRYYIYNDYPSYKPGRVCRYRATCPAGYQCRVDCELNMPGKDQNGQCSLDRFLVSRTGDPQLVGADVYCGRTKFTAVSTGNSIALGLIASKISKGGQYSCNLTTQLAPSTPPPSTCSCGVRRQTKIVGGIVAGVDEFPMMAGLIEKSIDDLYCGGVIISDQYILTAAHCLYRQSPELFNVTVGSRDLTLGKRFAIKSFIIHPQFNETSFDYDIGLVQLKTSLTFSSSVQPVCLPFKFANSDLTGRNCTFTGWGTQYPGGPKSSLLRKVDVNIISKGTCRMYAPNINERQICTYARGKDACQNDSGGPALFTDPTSGFLFAVGIVSNGMQCASNSPGYNTNVPALLSWIIDNARSQFCIKR